MKTLQGIARNVRLSTEVYGHDASLAATRHVALFEIENTTVEIKLSNNILISEDDSVIVAGNIENGVFKSLAYRNLTTGATGKNLAVVRILIGIAFIVAGIVNVLEMIIGVPLIITGVYLIYSGLKHQIAFNKMNSNHETAE